MTTEYLEWTDPEYRRLLSRRSSLEELIQEDERFIAECKKSLGYYQETIPLLEDIVDGINDNEFINFFKLRYIERTHSAVSEHKQTISIQEQSARSSMDSISLLNERLASMPNGEKRLHIPTAKTKLKGFPGVDPRTLSFGIDNKGPYMRWTSSGLKMRPDENPHSWIVAKEGTPVIPLQPIVTKVYLHTASVVMSHKRGQSDYSSYRFSGGKYFPHPHILNYGNPCLGDFQAPLAEAVHDQDLQTVVSLIKLFLERAISADAAGTNWVRYFTRFLPVGFNHNEFFQTPYSGSFKIYECEERGLYNIHEYDVDHNLVGVKPHPYNGIF